ncbi:MBL fold metallo-hydrolase [Brevibacillus migulae]|uniref:MBL fold metallo-hydrolase n=1 Tax=Brevibacillus migulae TaxID=1644114 RepID=UPI00106E5337|nr:MBL fold metallo-hydrolase [Brevibacillus migulae]
MGSRLETCKESKHFKLKQVTEGVYAAISIGGTGSLSNAAIIDLGDETLVVDTFLSIEAGRDLQAAAVQLTGRPVSYVFNTHWHSDHTFGNQVFAPTAQIISTSQTREIMATVVKERVKQHLSEPAAIYQAIDEVREKMELETDDKLKKEREWEIGSDLAYMKTLPELELTLPAVTFEQQLTIHGSKRKVELISYGGGHTQSDAFAYLPEERIAVMGDLVLEGHHPVMRYANPQEWLQILDRVEALGVDTIVPGHGEVCTLEALHQVRHYLHDVTALVEQALQTGRSIEDIQVPEAYRGWYFTGDFPANLQRLYKLKST